MEDSFLFWTVFSAVLGALMLAGSFFWGLMAYSRLETESRTHEATRAMYVAIFLPLVFLASGLYIAIGG